MKKLKVWLVWCCAAVLLAACGVGSSPEAVAEKYIKSLYTGDADTAFQLMSLPEDAQEAGVEDVLRGKAKAMVAEQKAKTEAAGGVKNITVSPAEYTDDKTRAEVKVSVTFKKSEQTANEHVRLIKTDDGWKIFL